MVEIYKNAWDIVKKDYLAWLILTGVFMLVTGMTMGLGGVLWPNVMRETRDAVREGRAPTLNTLFNLDRIVNDAINFGVYYVAVMATSMVGLTFIATMGLFWQTLLAAEDHYAPIDNAKLSLKHVAGNLVDHLGFQAIVFVVVMATACLCFLPLPFLLPIFGVAQWLWYEREIEHFDAMAEQSGILRQVTS